MYFSSRVSPSPWTVLSQLFNLSTLDLDPSDRELGHEHSRDIMTNRVTRSTI